MRNQRANISCEWQPIYPMAGMDGGWCVRRAFAVVDMVFHSLCISAMRLIVQDLWATEDMDYSRTVCQSVMLYRW